MTTPSMESLVDERDQLLSSLTLPDKSEFALLRDFLPENAVEELCALLGSPLERWDKDLSPVAARPILRLLEKSEPGARAIVQSDIDLIRDMLRSGKDTFRRTSYGLMDAAFPVRVQGVISQCVWCRGFLDRAFFQEEIDRLAELAGTGSQKVEAAVAKSTPLSAQQQEAMLGLVRQVRDALEREAEQFIRASEVTHQFVQSERTRALGTLSSGVAHHFNNLLSVILGYSSYVLNQEELSKEAEEALTKVSGAAQRGRRLTEEVLAFAGSEVEEETTCHLHHILTSVLSLLQSQASSRVQVETHLDATDDAVLAPPSAAHQLIFNLLTSAFDSMPAGGELHVATENRSSKTESGEIKQLILSITDSSGIASKTEPETGSAKNGERDLKLTRAEGIAGALQGSVSVAAGAGEKTRVEVILPCASPRQVSEEPAWTAKRITPSTIWVVDDDMIFREMCKQTLGSEGHTVEEMESGPEMQDRWQGGPKRPDLLVIDFSMPDYNGLELCQWLKENGSTVPVILVSGFAPNHPDIHQALQFRKTYFLQKPFSYRELLDTVIVALGETLIEAAHE